MFYLFCMLYKECLDTMYKQSVSACFDSIEGNCMRMCETCSFLQEYDEYWLH